MFRFLGLCLGTLVRFLRASEPPTRESGATSTTRRPETSTSAAKTRPARQALPGRRPPILVRIATIPHCGHARNRGALAQGRLTFLRNHREAIARDGLLYCSDDHLQRALLLFRHQSRSSAHPALQCHKASDKLVDRPAVARSISI